MYAEPPVRVTFRTSEKLMDQVVDWFGKDITVHKDDNGDTVEVSIQAAPTAMLYWALQYAEYVEILTPESLRERIIGVLKHASEVYKEEKL